MHSLPPGMDERNPRMKSNDLPVAKSSNTDKLRSSCKNQKRKNGDSGVLFPTPS